MSSPISGISEPDKCINKKYGVLWSHTIEETKWRIQWDWSLLGMLHEVRSVEPDSCHQPNQCYITIFISEL